MNYRITPQGPMKLAQPGIAGSHICEICGIVKAKKVHTKCSKIKQALFAKERAA